MVDGRKSIVDRILKGGEGSPLENLGMAVVGQAADDYIEASVMLIRNNDEYEFASNRIKALRSEIAEIRKEMKEAKKALEKSKVVHKVKAIRLAVAQITDDQELNDMLRHAHGKLMTVHRRAQKRVERAKYEYKKIGKMNDEIRQLIPTDNEYRKHLRMVEECKEFFTSGNAAYYVYDFDSTDMVKRLDAKVQRIINSGEEFTDDD